MDKMEDSYVFVTVKSFFLFVLVNVSINKYPTFWPIRADLMMPYYFHKNPTLGKHFFAECWGTQLTLVGRSRWKFCDGVLVQSI